MKQSNTCVCSFNLNQLCRCYTLLSIAAHLIFGFALIIWPQEYGLLKPEMIIGAIFLSMGLINIIGLFGMETKKVAVIQFYLLAQRVFALAMFVTIVYFYMMSVLLLVCKIRFAPSDTVIATSLVAVIGTLSFPLHLYFGIHIPNRFCIFIDNQMKDEKESARDIDIDETLEMTVLEKGYCAMA